MPILSNFPKKILCSSLKVELDNQIEEVKQEFELISEPFPTRNLWTYGDVQVERVTNVYLTEPLPSGVYTFSADIISNDTDSEQCSINLYDTNNNNVGANVISRGERVSCTITAKSEISRILLTASRTTALSVGDTATFSDVQLELGTTATDYIEPYTYTAKDIIARDKLNEVTGWKHKCAYDFSSHTLKGISHGGYNSTNADGAPINTISAFKLSANKGFKFVETDVRFTSDNVPVLLHNATIDATSDGTGAIADMTFTQVREYDFGSWVSEEYAGEKIPSFEEFIVFCRDSGLYPYIELSNNIFDESGELIGHYSEEQLDMVVDIVKRYKMERSVTWISFHIETLQSIVDRDKGARVGFLREANSSLEGWKNKIQALRTGINEVFVNLSFSTGSVSESDIEIAKTMSLPVETWVVDGVGSMKELDDYISGVTSNCYNFEEVKTEKVLGEISEHIPDNIPCDNLEGVVYVNGENLVGGTYTYNTINSDGSLEASTAKTWALWDDVIDVPNPGTSTIYRLNNIGTSTIVLYRGDGTIYARKSLSAGAEKSYTITNTSVTKVRITEQITNLTDGQTWAWEEVTEFVPYGAEPGYNFDGNPMYADIMEQIDNSVLGNIPCSKLEGVVYNDSANLIGGTYTNNIINADGTLTAQANWVCWDDVITVPNPTAGTDTIYRFNNTGASTVVLYRQDGTVYARKTLAAGGDKSYTIPTNIYTIRFVDQIANLTEGQTWAWEEVTEFIPYGAKPGYNYDGNPMYADLDNQIEEVNDKVQNANNLNLNILCLGDSIFGNDGEIVNYLTQFTGSTVTNGAIGGTRASVRISDTDAFQYLDGKNLVQALTSGNWTDQDSAVTTLGESYPWLSGRIDTLKAVDMSKVDLVTMDWGTNDYAGAQTVDTITSAYNDIIDMLQSTYPELRILITTPIWRYFDDTENGDNKVYAGATLKEIAEAIETFAKEKRVHVLNAYQEMPLNYNTAATYFDTGSGVHLNAKGNKLYAHLLNGKIRSLY